MSRITFELGSADGRPVRENITSGAKSDSLMGEEKFRRHDAWWLSENQTITQVAANTAPQDISAMHGSLFQRRMAQKIQEVGGYGSVRGVLRTVCDLLDRNVHESMPTRQWAGLVDEALGTGAFDSLLDDAQHKRLQKGFQYRVGPWGMVAFKRRVADFKAQHSIHAGNIGVLPQVQKSAPYLNVQFSDDEATYKVAKYGAIYAAGMEALVNDDLQALGRVAEKLGMAFQFTLDDFVFSTLIDENNDIYDGTALFTTAHANALGASKALGHDNLESAKKQLMAQTDLDGNPLMLEPKYLIVHSDQQHEAERLVKSPLRPGVSDNDINVHQGTMEVLVTNRITSGYWYVAADPRQLEWLELGFLQGREEPELFTEATDTGRWFDFDEKRWKGRLIFGGAITDYRGIVGANFAV